MKKTFSLKNLSIKTKLLIMISALTIGMVLLVSVLNYGWHSKQVTNQTINQTQQIIDQIGSNIDNYIDELFRLTLSPYYDDEIMSELEHDVSTSEDILYKKRKIESFLASVMTLPRNEILRVYILTDKDIYSYTRTPYEMRDFYTYKKSSWYQETLKTTKPVFIPIHAEKAFGDKQTQILSIARKIRSKENNELTLGVVKVDADYTGIKSICDKVQFEDKGALFVINENKEIVYQNNELDDRNLLNKITFEKDYGYFTNIIDGEKYIINIATLEDSGLKVIAVNSFYELTKTARKNLSKSIALVLVCVILSIFILKLVIKGFFRPLFNIIDSMKIVENGDLSVQVEVKNNDEIGYLASSFNRMILRLKNNIEKNTQLVKEVYEARYLHKESQYNALCSQIKPHFLYNTLNTISLLIKCEEKSKAVYSIENLSYFLRGIMNTDKDITLATELEIIESYLEIQQIRYGDNLNYNIQIDPEYLSYKIPALTLQPIVENAIIHGCEQKRGKSQLDIYSKVDKEYLMIYICDNGKGMDSSKFSKLLEKFNETTPFSYNDKNPEDPEVGIGLINVNRRLKLKFGSKAGLHIVSDLGKGTTVILRIPK
ncbi:MAG: sensor histidine kinase [Clostridiales bacterium]|nr:sensor histidine kinase [Clostridiales bacterium]